MTRALILAAGQGSRLRPLTNDKPKGLVEFAGLSLLQRQIDTLKVCGIKNIQIVTGFCAEQIEQLGQSTCHNRDFANCNMVESLFCAEEFMATNEDLIIAYGDIVYQTDNLLKMLQSQADIALMIDKQWHKLWSLRFEDPLVDAETLMINERGYITEIGNKPDDMTQIQGQYTGLIKINATKVSDFIGFYRNLNRNMDYDGKCFEQMYMTRYIQLLIDHGWQVSAIEVNSGWLEVDTLSDLQLYQKMAEQGILDPLFKVI